MLKILKTILSPEPADLSFEGGGNRRDLTVIRSPRARRMRLVVDPRGGAVKLTLPKRGPLAPALAWVETKRSWVEAQLAALPGDHKVEPGMRLTVAGEELLLDWSPAYPRTPKISEQHLRIGGPIESLSPRLIRWLRREAVTLFAAESREYAAKIAVTLGTISVGDPVSRWGSCAASGNIRYSWRLILAPSFVRRATIAHEVAHRVHMNHSPAFHALVATLFEEDPTLARRWLRAHGPSIHGLGRSA